MEKIPKHQDSEPLHKKAGQQRAWAKGGVTMKDTVRGVFMMMGMMLIFSLLFSGCFFPGESGEENKNDILQPMSAASAPGQKEEEREGAFPEDGAASEEPEIPAGSVKGTEKENREAALQDYYEAIAIGEIIVVYKVDPQGARQLVYRTQIPYAFLSETDQALFDRGIRLADLKQVEALLQDFES